MKPSSSDDGKDEVVLFLGQVEVFLTAQAQAQAAEAAGGDGVMDWRI